MSDDSKRTLVILGITRTRQTSGQRKAIERRKGGTRRVRPEGRGDKGTHSAIVHDIKFARRRGRTLFVSVGPPVSYQTIITKNSNRK